MQMYVTDLFTERGEQSNKQNNAYQKQTCEDDTLSLIESDGRTKIEKCCSFVIQKQILLYIIHFTHDLLLQFTQYCSLHYHSEYASAFNNWTRQCLFSTYPSWNEFVWILSQFCLFPLLISYVFFSPLESVWFEVTAFLSSNKSTFLLNQNQNTFDFQMSRIPLHY